jgi:hypothetical protein
MGLWSRIWSKLTGKSESPTIDIVLESTNEDQVLDEEQYRREYNKKLFEEYQREAEARRNRTVDFVWCLVGNIVDERVDGATQQIRKGTKHFSPGTKVYCFPPQWGDGYEKIYVIGRPRKSSRFIKVIIHSDWITNWRVQKVYSQHIKREMIYNNGWGETDESKKKAETLLTSIAKYRDGKGS